MFAIHNCYISFGELVHEAEELLKETGQRIKVIRNSNYNGGANITTSQTAN